MVSQLQEWGTEVCWICILDFFRGRSCARSFGTKNRSNQKNFIYPEFLMVKKRAIFGKIRPKLIVRRIFTTKLNPPEPMEAKIIDPNSVGVILRMVNKGHVT